MVDDSDFDKLGVAEGRAPEWQEQSGSRQAAPKKRFPKLFLVCIAALELEGVASEEI
ncbi:MULTISPECIES: hypothetical protein [Bradyrhizobium]|uniref:hypothetical protein n=1 Tax=Bradyrhizobium TaxID=374 RepID=UPI001EDA9F69|nr:hypothetical protein [Bradyrhizobium zhengyangense]MCG2639668.1 hypothetical protein [Bradyrhizobium zhengyangense]